jgi:uncharacterized protein (DUF433 family)
MEFRAVASRAPEEISPLLLRRALRRPAPVRKGNTHFHDFRYAVGSWGSKVVAVNPRSDSALGAGVSRPGADRRIMGMRMNGQAIVEHPLARISVDPAKRSGQACIRDLRMTVKDVLEYLAGGMSESEILADFPYLEREDFAAVYAYAAAELAASHR